MARLKREKDDLLKLVGELTLKLKRGEKIRMVSEMKNKFKNLTKAEVAKKLGVSRSSLYYRHRKPVEDLGVKAQIESVLTDHPRHTDIKGLPGN